MRKFTVEIKYIEKCLTFKSVNQNNHEVLFYQTGHNFFFNADDQ